MGRRRRGEAGDSTLTRACTVGRPRLEVVYSATCKGAEVSAEGHGGGSGPDVLLWRGHAATERAVGAVLEPHVSVEAIRVH